MRKISKGNEPIELTTWKRRHPRGTYGDTDPQVKQAIRQACITEQFGLCAYCCKPITSDNASSHNEHVEAQNIAPSRTVDFDNIVASCETREQCGKSHRSQHLPLTPLMDACESEIKFTYSGKIEGLTNRASAAINVLNLKNRSLQHARKLAIEALLYEYGCPPEETVDLDADTIVILLEYLSPSKAFNLKPYSPVLANILRIELQNFIQC